MDGKPDPYQCQCSACSSPVAARKEAGEWAAYREAMKPIPITSASQLRAVQMQIMANEAGAARWNRFYNGR